MNFMDQLIESRHDSYNYNYGDLIRIEKQLNVAGRYTTFNKRDIELFASYKRMKREWEWIREMV